MLRMSFYPFDGVALPCIVPVYGYMPSLALEHMIYYFFQIYTVINNIKAVTLFRDVKRRSDVRFNMFAKILGNWETNRSNINYLTFLFLYI